MFPVHFPGKKKGGSWEGHGEGQGVTAAVQRRPGWGGDSFQDIPGADVLEGKFHTPSVRLLAWRGVSNRRKRLTATVPIDLAAHFSSQLGVCFVLFRSGG